MKNFKKVLLLFLVILTIWNIGSFFQVSAWDIAVRLNGSQIQFDQPPIIQNGRTLVPMRAIFEAMGCNITWYQYDKSITAVANDGTVIHMQIDNSVMTVNGNEIIVIMWTPTRNSGAEGHNMGNVRINLPAGFVARDAYAVRSNENVKFQREEVRMNSERTVAIIPLPISNIVSIRFTR